jgi:hypothetical protein
MLKWFIRTLETMFPRQNGTTGLSKRGSEIRVTINGLPFRTVPKVMIRKLATLCVQQLYMFPARGGVSPYLCPHTIMTGQAVDYEKDLKVNFGTLVQVMKEATPYNTPEPRTIDAVCLGPAGNRKGGYSLMALPTGRLITRARVREVPMTNMAIERIEALAEAQGIHPLRNHYRGGTIAKWIVGVDDSNSKNSDSKSDEELHLN